MKVIFTLSKVPLTLTKVLRYIVSNIQHSTENTAMTRVKEMIKCSM